MSTTYSAYIDESPADLNLLKPNNLSIQLAKTVASGGNSTPNVVFQSQNLSPVMSIQWTDTYGLNWTTSMPSAGAKVEYSGSWQACALGQSYTLNDEGLWVAAQSDPNANAAALNVASNDYAQQVNIVVGVQSQSGDWEPIWVGPDALLKGNHGQYQPLETVKIWYQEGQQTATMISDQSSNVQTYEMTPTATYFSYDATAGKWRTPQTTAFNFSS